MAEDHDKTTLSERVPLYELRWSAADTETALLILGIKTLIFLFAALAVGTLFDRYCGMREMWNRWDALHYQALAEFGYTAEGEGRFSIGFFPLYPWLVRTFALVTRSYFVAALAVTGIASVLAGLLLRRLAELDFSPAVARKAVWFLFIFPTSYFLHIGYSESLFLALVLGSILAARTKHWMVAGLLGACACLARLNGFILGPTLLVEAWLQYRVTRRIDWRWLWIGAVGAGVAGHLALNYHVTGDGFAFLKVQEEHWFKRPAPPWVGVVDLWRRIPDSNLTEGLYEFAYLVLAFACIICSWCVLRPSYSVWITLNWLLFTSVAFVLSVPRFCLTLFPIFILSALLAAKRPLVSYLLTAISLLFLALFATKFAFGTWAF